MHLSLNEVETTTRKALIGAGTDPGAAADVAAAVRWLCEQGREGVGIVLAAIRNSADFAALVSGVDAAIAGDGKPITVDRNAMLFAALLGPAAAVFGLRFELTGSDWSAAVAAGELAGSIGDGPVTVRAVKADVDASVGATANISVDQAEWAILGELAARIYVPSSEQSRTSGAGAGLTDND